MKDAPMINSLMDEDFYKFTMGQFVLRRFPNVSVTSGFRNRTKNVHLGKILDLGAIREEFEHVRSLRFNNSELHYLRGTNEYGERMFCEPYLQFLKGLRMPEYHLERNGDDLDITFEGLWPLQIYWETIALSIINEHYTRTLMEPLSRFERDVVYAKGRTRLMEKIVTLRKHPGIKFSDFGTRRRFSAKWQEYVDETLRDELPEQFLGTSNAYLANQTGVVPMGTSAHELQMVVAGLHEDDGRDDWLRIAQKEVTDGWWDEYNEGLSIFLPDTYGSDFFLSNLTKEDLERWKGFRQDSGTPFVFGEKIIARYQEEEIDHTQKLLIPSDGLTIEPMIQLDDRFGERIKVSDGWGTNLTNDLFDNVWVGDLYYGPLSLVVKPILADGHHLVKLSDNLAKATGRPEDVERYKRAAGYTNTERVECTY